MAWIRHAGAAFPDFLHDPGMRGRDGISRALYVAATGQHVVIVQVFVKKTQKTPRREIDLALSRAKEVLL
jgi:phage-related protein